MFGWLNRKLIQLDFGLFEFIDNLTDKTCTHQIRVTDESSFINILLGRRWVGYDFEPTTKSIEFLKKYKDVIVHLNSNGEILHLRRKSIGWSKEKIIYHRRNDGK